MDKAQLDAIWARIEAYDSARLQQRNNVTLYMSGRHGEVIDNAHMNLLDAAQDLNDNAPDDIRALLAHIDALEAEVARLRDGLETICRLPIGGLEHMDRKYDIGYDAAIERCRTVARIVLEPDTDA